MSASRPLRIEGVLDRVEEYLPDADDQLLRHAYVYAANRHEGQERRSGEPYMTHPLAVAWILTEMELDEVAIASGLLHDILEDTDTSADELEAEFGPTVTGVVAALTKISSYESSFESHEATLAENFRRLLLASMDDVRVILVKLADRLHNMRTLEYMPPDRQRSIAQETLDIYAPISNRLGIGFITRELEDLCFRYLYRHDSERLENALEDRKAVVDRWYGDLETELRKVLTEAGIEGTIHGRVKHRYSIWEKLRRQQIDVANVFDFLAFRIIVDDVAECYAVLGLIHQRWSPVPGRIKDYIAMPKPNAYQSLHTTVLGPEGHPFEIQIRTATMHEIAEHGIAAHWQYKDRAGATDGDDSRVAWLRGLLDTTEGSTPREFLDSLRVDLYPEEVYCFTPRGDVFSFPRGAMVLDFAYRVHTEVGHRCTGARISGRWVPLKTELGNGDVVEIITSSRQTPRRDWLDLVITGRARSKIRSWLRKKEQEDALDVGWKLLDRELRRRGSGIKRAMETARAEDVAARHGLGKPENLISAVGFGRLDAAAVAEGLVADEGPEEPPDVMQITSTPDVARTQDGFLQVSGSSDFLVYLAKCCNPVPGEDIVGYVTRGRGVAVHRRRCPNVEKLLLNPEREIEVRWVTGAEESESEVRIRLTFRDRHGMLATISQAIADEKSNILSCQLMTEKGGRGSATLTIAVQGAGHLDRVLTRLHEVDGVFEVER